MDLLEMLEKIRSPKKECRVVLTPEQSLADARLLELLRVGGNEPVQPCSVTNNSILLKKEYLNV